MTKEELEKEAEKHADGIYHYKINVSDYGEDGIINYRYSDVKEAYLASAEPREKRIAELEKENAELKADNDARKFAMAMSEKVEKKLREKNEELKETVTKMNNVITETFSNLTKAKELLKKIYNFEYGVESDFPKFDLVKWSIETRDFLKDIEVEK